MSYRSRSWEDIGEIAEEHRRDRAEKHLPAPVFDIGDTVRVSEAVALAAAGHTGIVADVDPATTDDTGISYQVTLDGPNPPACAGGWWLDELLLFPHDREWEDDGA